MHLIKCRFIVNFSSYWNSTAHLYLWAECREDHLVVGCTASSQAAPCSTAGASRQGFQAVLLCEGQWVGTACAYMTVGWHSGQRSWPSSDASGISRFKTHQTASDFKQLVGPGPSDAGTVM